MLLQLLYIIYCFYLRYLIIFYINIQKIITNGKKADALYKKYIEPETNIKAVCLPSTSPANAQWSLDRLCDEWKNELR